MNAIANQFGPYHYQFDDHKREVTFDLPCGVRTFVIILSTAYNAFGLIGPEHNGIVILDKDNEVVILDRALEQSTGYFGANRHQLEMFESISGPDRTWQAFMECVDSSTRKRFTFDDDGALTTL